MVSPRFPIAILSFLCLPCLPAHAGLPELRPIALDWDLDDFGRPLCQSQRLKIGYVEQGTPPEAWKIQVRLDGRRTNRAKYEQTPSGTEFTVSDFPHLFPGVRTKVEIRSHDDRGNVSPWSSPVFLTMPRCDGLPLDGKAHLYHTYIPVVPFDLKDQLPFAAENLHQNIAYPISDTESISVADFFEDVSYDQISIHEQSLDWTILPRELSYYCKKLIGENGELGTGCSKSKIWRDAIEILEAKGTLPNDTNRTLVMHGYADNASRHSA